MLVLILLVANWYIKSVVSVSMWLKAQKDVQRMETSCLHPMLAYKFTPSVGSAFKKVDQTEALKQRPTITNKKPPMDLNIYIYIYIYIYIVLKFKLM